MESFTFMNFNKVGNGIKFKRFFLGMCVWFILFFFNVFIYLFNGTEEVLVLVFSLVVTL